LTITAYNADRWYSGKIATRDKFFFKYGRVDAKIRLPAVPGAFPAFWLLPQYNVYGAWPNSGEIDIVEYQSVWGTGTPGSLHFAAHHAGDALSFWCKNNLTPQDWHIYSVIWEPDYIAFLFDNIEYGRYTKPPGSDWYNWPYDQEFYIIVNLAIWPSWGSSPTQNQMTMDVDWITVSRNVSRIH
jgi:beta-glucanase (GH16 family)